MSLGPALANLGYLAAAAPARRRLARALRNPEEAQRAILWRIIRASSSTSFGREHRLGEIRCLEDWRDRVPLRDFDGFRPYVDRIASGEAGVLTGEPVRFMEPTGGSSGVEKLVPYTPSLLREFSAATLPWVFDLLSHRPRVRAGRAYWAVSPPMRRAVHTDGGVPIGADDSDYFPAIARRLLDQTMVVPAGAQLDVGTWRLATLRALLGARDLALISVWSPSFLTLLADALDDSFPQLVSELPHLRKRFGGRPPQDLGELWPRLDIISCWTDGSAASSLGPMRERFPRVEVQGKGLLATEGVVSFPLLGLAAPVAAVTSHFLEFLDATGQARMVHELSTDERYEVVITTGGGFQRYRLKDVVEVVGFVHATPLLRFVGRSDGASDLAGEKLTPALVQAVIERVSRDLSVQPRFVVLAPLAGDPPGYGLFAELDDPGRCDELGARVEALLADTHHYRLCRQLGQLAPVRAIPISGGALRYEQVCIETGQRPGSIKPPSLDASAERGRRLAESVSVVR